MYIQSYYILLTSREEHKSCCGEGWGEWGQIMVYMNQWIYAKCGKWEMSESEKSLGGHRYPNKIALYHYGIKSVYM